MAQVEQTMEEVLDSLTGFDEMAIAGQFGRTMSELAERDELMAARALVFIAKRRDGMPDVDAKTTAFEMALKEVRAFFTEPAEESEETGKGEPVSAPQPAPSLSSVS